MSTGLDDVDTACTVENAEASRVGGSTVVSFHALRPVQDSSELLKAYEGVRDALPHARFTADYERQTDLGELTTRFDAFFFDAFGVLNIGETAIDKAAERVAAIRQAGRQVRIVSNAGSVPLTALHAKYTRLGFDFAPEEIVSSRLPMLDYLRTQPARIWGVMAPAGADISDLDADAINLTDQPDAFDDVEGFILLSAAAWTDVLHERLLTSLKGRPRPVLLANPDLAAPRETGFSVEPGQLAHHLRTEAGSEIISFGKPYPAIFDLALGSLEGQIHPERVLMIGDTLHTDVLGGCSAGLSTALVTAQGASASLDWAAAMHATGIIPDYVLDHI